MEIGKTYSETTVEEFHVKRDGDSFLVSFSFISYGELISVKLKGVRETEGLCGILSADRMWVEKLEGRHLEFGGYILGLSSEYHTEITFDALL